MKPGSNLPAAAGGGNSPLPKGEAGQRSIQQRAKTAFLGAFSPWTNLLLGRKGTTPRPSLQQQPLKTPDPAGVDGRMGVKLEPQEAHRGSSQRGARPGEVGEANPRGAEGLPAATQEGISPFTGVPGARFTAVDGKEQQSSLDVVQRLRQEGLAGFFALAWYDAQLKRPASLQVSLWVNGILIGVVIFLIKQIFFD